MCHYHLNYDGDTAVQSSKGRHPNPGQHFDGYKAVFRDVQGFQEREPNLHNGVDDKGSFIVI